MAKEGWTPEHDDAHDAGELASAAACYAINAASTLHPYDGLGIQLNASGAPEVPWWPWDVSWWKPGEPLRDLVRAGALIAAEIDRLQRTRPTPTEGERDIRR